MRRPLPVSDSRPSASSVHAAQFPRLTRLSLIVVLVLLGSACARPAPGPSFFPAADPLAHRARLYVFRTDARSSFSRVRVTLDGQNLGTFQNGEYETVELPAGPHHLRAGLRSLAGVAWGWNEDQIHLRPGETVYVEMSVRMTQIDRPGGRSLEIAGRSSSSASENVYLQRLPPKDALERMGSATRIAH